MEAELLSGACGAEIAGIDLRDTSADIKTTERYAHLHEDPINKAIDVVSLKIKKVMEL